MQLIPVPLSELLKESPEVSGKRNNEYRITNIEYRSKKMKEEH